LGSLRNAYCLLVIDMSFELLVLKRLPLLIDLRENVFLKARAELIKTK
jgi:hypothetical protein